MTPRAIDAPALAAPGGHYSHPWPAFDAVHAEWAGAHKLARAVVPVPQLHFGSLIEIEAIAALPSA